MEKKFIALLTGLIVMLALSSVAWSAEGFALSKGDKEVSLAGGYQVFQFEDTATTPDDLYIVNLSGSLGYFLTDKWEFAVNASYIDASMGFENTSIGIAGIGATIKYHFLTSGPALPYIGGLYSYASYDVEAAQAYNDVTNTYGMMDIDSRTSILGPLAGIKFPVNDSVCISAEWQYEWFSEGLGQLLNTANIISVGISFKF